MARKVRMKFRGRNNVTDPIELGRIKDYRAPVITEHVEITNFDCGDRMEAVVRAGRTLHREGSATVLWGSDRTPFRLAVEGSVLYQLDASLVFTALLSLGTNTACFAEVNTGVAFSDGLQTGFLDSSGAAFFADPGEDHHAVFPGCHLLGKYSGRLFGATAEGIVFSPASYVDRVDTEFYLIPLPGKPTMLQPTTDGIWVSYAGVTAFMRGGEPDDFQWEVYSDFGALPGTATRFYPARTENKARKGTVYWATPQGICSGSASGEFTNLSAGENSLPTAEKGIGFVREQNGGVVYIVSLQEPGEAPNLYISPVP